ncbi:hypothetical protein, partial [Burkholderia multivorans]|uniref:hypothetical protein n=1 Tax=Burkholderia multivorans TaxID=87883 RepID=UPI0028700DB6
MTRSCVHATVTIALRRSIFIVLPKNERPIGTAQRRLTSPLEASSKRLLRTPEDVPADEGAAEFQE